MLSVFTHLTFWHNLQVPRMHAAPPSILSSGVKGWISVKEATKIQDRDCFVGNYALSNYVAKQVQCCRPIGGTTSASDEQIVKER